MKVISNFRNVQILEFSELIFVEMIFMNKKKINVVKMILILWSVLVQPLELFKTHKTSDIIMI